MPRFKDQVKQIIFEDKSPSSESYSEWFTTKQVIQIKKFRRSQDETFKIQENLKVKKKVRSSRRKEKQDKIKER
jgi:hypothetical protein